MSPSALSGLVVTSYTLAFAVFVQHMDFRIGGRIFVFWHFLRTSAIRYTSYTVSPVMSL